MNSVNPLQGSEPTMAIKKKNVSGVKTIDVLSITLRYWYWVVISVAVCMGIAYYMVKSTVPIYTRSCSVIIRDDALGSVGASSVDLTDIGIGMSNTILEDEMAALKSPDLMEQVVKKLNLQVSYLSPGTFHDNTLYGSNLPVRVSFPDMAPEEWGGLTLDIDATGDITVSRMWINRKRVVLPNGAKVKFGSVIGTPSGRIIIDKTPFYKPGKPYTIIVTRASLRGATEGFESTIGVSQSNKRSNVVIISCNDASIQRADEILTSLVNAYNQDWIRSRAEVVAVTSNFITDRLNSLEAELGTVDSDISSFKSTNQIPDLGAAASMAMQQSGSASTQISALSNQLQMARYMRNYISTEGKNNVLPVNTGLGNAESMISQYNALVMQRNSHLANTSENNPLIVDLDSRMASMRSSLLSSIDTQIISLQTAISNLERSNQTAIARVAANPRQAKYLLTAERQQKVKESLYLYLLQKREENELSQAFTSVNTRILRQPSGFPIPTLPKTKQTYMMAFIIGLVIPFGFVYVLEASNTRIRGKKDLEGLIIPIVGEIPQTDEGKRVKHGFNRFVNPSRQRDKLPIEEDVVVKEGSRDLVNEAFRVLRTNINFITNESLPCVAMITSFNPGSGKTFISVNLGISLALKGRKVLFIDGDLRRASLSEFVKSPTKGLADYLSGSVRDIDQVIVSDTIQPGLSILPVGHIPPNPTELLETKRFANLIDYLKSEYEYVFIDCPPIHMMADASIINSVCDRTFFVVRVALFERNMVNELDKLYTDKQFRNMSIILNGSMTGTRYGYRYRYGYGYAHKNYYKGYHKGYYRKGYPIK